MVSLLRIDDGIVQFLKGQATEEGMIGAHSNLAVGQEVCITDGPLEGLKGIIQQPPDAKRSRKSLNDAFESRPHCHRADCLRADWLGSR